MKAAIIGYGKMGREIEKILIERGHDVTLVIDTDNAADLNAANLAGVDVAPCPRRPTPISAPASKTRLPW